VEVVAQFAYRRENLKSAEKFPVLHLDARCKAAKLKVSLKTEVPTMGESILGSDQRPKLRRRPKKSQLTTLPIQNGNTSDTDRYCFATTDW
jgi:hypothetical protein